MVAKYLVCELSSAVSINDAEEIRYNLEKKTGLPVIVIKKDAVRLRLLDSNGRRVKKVNRNA